MKTLLVISNFNEEGVISNTIQETLDSISGDIDLLIIDNASSDESLKKIGDFPVNYLVHPVNTGGSAGVIKTALRYADYYDYDIYCHMDGDNQHNASELSKIIQPIKDGEANIVIGSRFIKKQGFQSSFLRRIGINMFSKILSKTTGNKLTDITSGFRAYDRKAIHYFAHKYKHEMEASVQMLLLASFAKLKIMEVPVLMNPRTTGKSEINIIGALKFPVYATISLIGTILQKKQ